MRPSFYDLLGVPPYATHTEITAAVRERLATTWGDEREVIINAANTLLDRESRESYDRLNGIAQVAGRAAIASDNSVELEKYAEAERIRRVESAYAELKWTLNFIAAGLGIGIWLLIMYQFIPLITSELDRFLVAMPDFTPVIAGLVLTFPALVLGFVAMNLFSESLHITIRFLIVCVLLGVIVSDLGVGLMTSEAVVCVRLLGMFLLVIGSVMVVRYLGIRQLRTIGEVRPSVSNRRDQK